MNISLELKNDIIRFKKANKARKRVLIAKDVISQILAKKFIIRSMLYVNVPNQEGETVDQNFVIKNKCECCGIGAAFVSALRLGNKYSTKLGVYSSELSPSQLHPLLERYFDKKQISLIEACFEKFTQEEGVEDKDEIITKFWKKYNNSEDRAIGIFENIIKNKGEFIP